jgi:hypothetical protein
MGPSFTKTGDEIIIEDESSREWGPPKKRGDQTNFLT